MDNVFTDKELKQIKSIQLLCFDINDTCYQIMDRIKELQTMYVLSPHDVDIYLKSINKLRKYIKENVEDKYTLS